MNIRSFENQIARIIPSFAGFTEFTASVPKIYWDVKSQEQRILGICKMLDKVICYADMLGENVDEIAKALKDIEDGKLDDLITAAIEQWFEDHETQILQDIEDLKESVRELERALGEEQDARIDADNALDEAIDEVADRLKTENEVYTFSSDMNKTAYNATFELESALKKTDFDNFTFAGKTIDEVFDPDAPWYMKNYIDTSNWPSVSSIQPTVTGEIAYDDATDTISFDSTASYAGNSAYFTWTAIPNTAGHFIAVFTELEIEEHETGMCGIETGSLAFADRMIGRKQIVGVVRELTSNTFNIVLGNVPVNESLYVFETPNMKSRLIDLQVIDLTILMNDGMQDDPALIAQAYVGYLSRKEDATPVFKLPLKLSKAVLLDDLEAHNTFISIMNRYALNIGMERTTFNTPSGYPRKPFDTDADARDNSFSTPIDMLKMFITASNNENVAKPMRTRYNELTFASGFQSATVTPPFTILTSQDDMPYKRFYGKGGSLNSSFTVPYLPHGTVNNVTAVELKKGHTGYVSVFSTPYNDPGNGIVYNNVKRYVYLIIRALNSMIDGTAADDVVLETDLQNAVDYAAQPLGFAAMIAPPGFDRNAVSGLSITSMLAWLNEGNWYLGRHDGTDENDSPVITASCAKVMTAYIAACECDMNDVLVMKQSDWVAGSGAPYTNAQLKLNNLAMTMKDAITAMLIYSDNRIATAIARHVANVYANKSVMGYGGVIY